MPYAVTEGEAALFTRHGLPVPERLYQTQTQTENHPQGCAKCNHSGHAGRMGIFEMAEVSQDLRAAIDRGASETELKTLALGAGESLIGQGLQAAARGEVSLAETLRVVGDVA